MFIIGVDQQRVTIIWHWQSIQLLILDFHFKFCYCVLQDQKVHSICQWFLDFRFLCLFDLLPKLDFWKQFQYFKISTQYFPLTINHYYSTIPIIKLNPTHFIWFFVKIVGKSLVVSLRIHIVDESPYSLDWSIIADRWFSISSFFHVPT